MVARYWSLKREARRGAPLLKRLHLEPWTANGANGQSDEDKEMKLAVCIYVWLISHLSKLFKAAAPIAGGPRKRS